MNPRNTLTLIALGSLVALVACSSAEEDKFGSSSSFCTAKAEAECNGLAKKCGASSSACNTARVSQCNTDANTFTSQGRSYRSGAVQDCLDSINDTYKDNGNDVTPENEKKTASVCGRVFSGSKQAADPCATSFECEGALICDKGVCVTEERVDVKQQCNNAGQTCETGVAYCAQQGATKFCVASKELNQPCAADAPCIGTLRCVTGSCIAKVTAGGNCDSDDQCAPEAPYCDATTKRCRPKYESTSAACKPFGL